VCAREADGDEEEAVVSPRHYTVLVYTLTFRARNHRRRQQPLALRAPGAARERRGRQQERH
jgi:hypothetical protein